jgi:hypothetical protein
VDVLLDVGRMLRELVREELRGAGRCVGEQTADEVPVVERCGAGAGA